MNFEKYRKADTIKLHGIYGDIYQESENLFSLNQKVLTLKSLFFKNLISIL